jgi:hypothetical protein
VTASSNSGHRTAETTAPSRLDRLLSLSRYDLVLVAIPLAFVLMLSAHLVLAVSVRLAVAGAAVTSVLVLLDAIYLNPPSNPGSGGTPR